ncbi:Nuclear speckle RNA-binding protein A [Zea mays]|uniref:Nuclear speckle RNA-binding protein A n=1 Tax=Zea mays TaxID=4577 RepID=B6SLS5_MAIZE|nr:hypothetical protein [Zea mays]AQL02434.1 Nuclear speckle RNA-binding protein A [Zea mays]|eukprot:NP_001142658.1 uncharacterized protein LOC100274945 [Zea mays]
MADAYWRYAAAAPRQQQQQQQPPPSAGGGVAHPGMGGGAPQMAPAGGQQQPMKRPRPTEFSGYKFDEHDRNSPNLRLQFARFAGPKGNSGPGGRGRR